MSESSFILSLKYMSAPQEPAVSDPRRRLALQAYRLAVDSMLAMAAVGPEPPIRTATVTLWLHQFQAAYVCSLSPVLSYAIDAF